MHGHARPHLADRKEAEGHAIGLISGQRQREADHRHVVAPLSQRVEHLWRDEVEPFDNEPVVTRRRPSWSQQCDAHYRLLLGRERSARAGAQAEHVLVQRRVRARHGLRQRGWKTQARLPSDVLLGYLGHQLRPRRAVTPTVQRDVHHIRQEQQQPRCRLCPVREELLRASGLDLGAERGAIIRLALFSRHVLGASQWQAEHGAAGMRIETFTELRDVRREEGVSFGQLVGT